MADLSTLAGLTFSPNNAAEDTFGQPTFNGDGSFTVTAIAPGIFSNEDEAAGSDSDPIEVQVVSYSTSSTGPYGLGSVVVNDVDTVTNAVVGTYTADIIGINAGQVLLGVQPYDSTDPSNPYNNNYTLLSDTSISQAGNTTTTYSTTLSDTNPNAYSPPCFAAGTRIATPDGEVAIEDLRAGDLVTTVSGHARRVIWTASRTVDIARHPRPASVRPVRIEAGAFDDNTPSRDLLLSPDHSVHVDGVLIPAKYLVNGSTVAILDRQTVTYHHIELETHDVVLANGLPAETYLDTGNRVNFATRNDTVFVPHPDFGNACDPIFFTWEAKGYAPLVLAGPELDAVRQHLAQRAGLTQRNAA